MLKAMLGEAWMAMGANRLRTALTEAQKVRPLHSDYVFFNPKRPAEPMNIDTVMLVLSFVALSIGCLILALDLFMRRMPLSPVPPQ